VNEQGAGEAMPDAGAAVDPAVAGPASVDPAAADLALVEVDGLVDLAREIARGAGELIHAGRRSGTAVASTKSSSVDVVTALDTEAERFIRGAIAQARPDDGVLGEEYGHQVGSSGLTWVVDPIDGTVNFLYGIPAYAVSIAAVVGDPFDSGARTVLAACVEAPAQGRSYWAGRGRGAWRNRLRVPVRAPGPAGPGPRGHRPARARRPAGRCRFPRPVRRRSRRARWLLRARPEAVGPRGGGARRPRGGRCGHRSTGPRRRRGPDARRLRRGCRGARGTARGPGRGLRRATDSVTRGT
jgi:hypothetical protein